MKAVLSLAACLVCAWTTCPATADETDKPLPPSQFNVSLVDGDAIGFATFQSHNQKVVSNQHGIFLAYLRAANQEYLSQTWRLSQTTDQGQSFTTLFEATHPTNPPVLETGQGGALFLIRPDFVDQSAYLYRFGMSPGANEPKISQIPRGSAGKFCMLLDPARKQIYYFAHNNTFHIVGLDGQLRGSTDLLKAGSNAILQYPHLTLDRDGTLYAAWTTVKYHTDSPTDYAYWDIHVIRSTDGAQSWQTLNGTQLQLPIVVDDGGPTDRITRDDEFEVHSWLSAFMVKDGKLHFVYWTRNQPERQRYVRYDLKTAQQDLDREPMFDEPPVETRNDSGALAARRAVSNSTLYFISTIEDRRRLACLASDDNGQTWYEYAVGKQKFSHRVYSIGCARELTSEGSIVGTFTDIPESAETYYEPQSGKVYFFRIQAGLSQATALSVKQTPAGLQIKFGSTRGQPSQVRFADQAGQWSAWHPFAETVTVKSSGRPHSYQLKSRLGVVAEPVGLSR